MTLMLPKLDDRRWEDLVEEGQALIPFYAPDWTDHNLHDPGITLIELFAWLAEQDLFELDQVTERQRLALLALIGANPRPVQPARALLELELADAVPIEIERGVEFAGSDLYGTATIFRSTHDITALPGSIVALQSNGAGQFRNLTGLWKRGEAILPFGEDPRRGSAFMIGIAPVVSWDAGWKVSLGFEIDGDDSGADDHHGVRLVWEIQNAAGTWVRADVEDSTRALSRSGRVELTLPDPPGKHLVGSVGWPLVWVRARIAGGRHDAAPVVRAIAFNAVEVEQATPAITRLRIAEGANVPVGPAPIGQLIDLDFDLDNRGDITRIAFSVAKPDGPPIRLIEWNPADRLAAFEALAIEVGNGAPSFAFELPGDPIIPASVSLGTLEVGTGRIWDQRSDFDASRRADANFIVESSAGRIVTGDGEHGRTVPAGAVVVTSGDRTRGAAGNLKAGAIASIAESIRNLALHSALMASKPFARIANVAAASGGANEESTRVAIARARAQREAPLRAVTLDDHVAMALQTPGGKIARAEARANIHPGFPCLIAPGIVTVMILPWLPAGRPEPTAGLRRLVADWLDQHRVIGTRIEVAGPTYVPVSVRADVIARADADQNSLTAVLAARIDHFLDPLVGGPDGTGWPFGRDIYRSEILQLIDETPGVAHVRALELVDRNGFGSCGNFCIGPFGLPDSQPHDLTVSHGRTP